jgi:hypothetical protein
MSPVIRVSDENYERLKAWATGWETQDDTLGRVLIAAGDPSTSVAPSTKTDTPTRTGDNHYEAWLSSRSEASRDIYAELLPRLDEVGHDIEIGKAPEYVKFMVSGFNFAEIVPRMRGLLIVVHSNGFGLEHEQSSTWEGRRLKRRSARAANTLDIEINVYPDTNLDSVVKALRMSYETIKAKHPRR